jgi:uncharacterized protein DUF1552
MRPLSRRTLLRGLGGAAIALPWLEAMEDRRASAATVPPRLIMMFSANGSLFDRFVPNTDAAGNITSMKPMHAPLEPFKSKLLVLGGVDMMSCEKQSTNYGGKIDVGHGLSRRHMLTGMAAIEDGSGEGLPGGPSIDQAIAQQVGGTTKFRSIELGVQVVEAPMVSSAARTIVQPLNDPKKAFAMLFAGVDASGGVDPAAARLQKRRRSVLDYVQADYTNLRGKVSAADAARLDTHLESIRQVERTLAIAAPTVSGTCAPPDPSAWPADKSKGNVAGPNEDFVPIGYAQMDLLAAAIGCNLTRVATLQWGGTGVYAPYLGDTFKTDHHTLSHNDQSAPGSPIEVIQNWYAKHFAYLLGKLDAMPEGNGTVLDNTAVVWFSEIAQGSHEHYDMPIVIAGGAGGAFKTGRYVNLNPGSKHVVLNPSWAREPPYGRTHNDLYLTFMNMMGAPATSFGDPQFCTGPIALG